MPVRRHFWQPPLPILHGTHAFQTPGKILSQAENLTCAWQTFESFKRISQQGRSNIDHQRSHFATEDVLDVLKHCEIPET